MPAIEVGQMGVGFNPQSFVNSDAYKFIRDQGQQGIERSAAARGTLLTGGTLKDLAQFNQGNAATFWGQQLNHDARMAELNAGILGGNANRTLSGLTSLMGNGLSAAGGMSGMYGNIGQAYGQGTLGGASAINRGVTAIGNSLGEILARQRNQIPSTTLPMNAGYNPGLFRGAMSPEELAAQASSGNRYLLGGATGVYQR